MPKKRDDLRSIQLMDKFPSDWMMAELLHQLAWGKSPPKISGGDLPYQKIKWL